VLAFEFSIHINDSFSWEEVLMRGYQLLQELAKARSGPAKVSHVLFLSLSFILTRVDAYYRIIAVQYSAYAIASVVLF